MSTAYDLTRAPLLMTEKDRQELLSLGWQPEVIASLHDRGFRPCRPDVHELRFGGADATRSMGFLRQTATPHIHISVLRDSPVHHVLELIDTAIYEAGCRAGHQQIADKFNAFTTACKSRPASMSGPNVQAQTQQGQARPVDEEKDF